MKEYIFITKASSGEELLQKFKGMLKDLEEFPNIADDLEIDGIYLGDYGDLSVSSVD